VIATNLQEHIAESIQELQERPASQIWLYLLCRLRQLKKRGPPTGQTSYGSKSCPNPYKPSLACESGKS
jgi:hypothetical protein